MSRQPSASAGWLRARKLSLGTCQQADIDQWLTSPEPGRHLARNFLVWCASRGYARNAEIPAGIRQSDRTVTMPDAGRRWSIARDLLHGPGHAAVDRVAGCLVLLYAQPLTRIATLTLAHVSESPAGLSLSLGSHPVDIPEPLAGLIRELTARRRGHTAIGRADDSTWLFPGGQPGRPISPQRLAARLTLLGIPARAGRTKALMDLACQLPAAVLSGASASTLPLRPCGTRQPATPGRDTPPRSPAAQHLVTTPQENVSDQPAQRRAARRGRRHPPR